MKPFLPLIAQTIVVALTVPLMWFLCTRVWQLGLHATAGLTAGTAMLAGLLAAYLFWKRGRRQG
jgi:hypothetical protein